jgi:hypothetical protein
MGLRVEKGEMVLGTMEPMVTAVDERRSHGAAITVGRSITRTAAAAPRGNGRRPQPHRSSSRFRFCPAAIRDRPRWA